MKTLIKKRLGRTLTTTNQYEEALLADVVLPGGAGEVTFDGIGGMENIKGNLQELIIWPLRRPDLYSTSNLLQPVKGVLLYGPPGTGKTMLAKAIANESGAAFINVRVSSLQSKWFGDAQKLVTAVFTLAWKLAPAIIFVDEVDSFLGKRRTGEHEAVTNMKTEFMTLWDGEWRSDARVLYAGAGGRRRRTLLRLADFECRCARCRAALTTCPSCATDAGFLSRQQSGGSVMVLAATNRPHELDEAILRRLPRHFEVPLPGEGDREAILRLLLKDEKVERNFDFRKLGKLTKGYSGSDLKDLAQQAALAPVRDRLREESRLVQSGVARERAAADASAIRAIRVQDFAEALDSNRTSGAAGAFHDKIIADEAANSVKLHMQQQAAMKEAMRAAGQDPKGFEQMMLQALMSNQ